MNGSVPKKENKGSHEQLIQMIWIVVVAAAFGDGMLKPTSHSFRDFQGPFFRLWSIHCVINFLRCIKRNTALEIQKELWAYQVWYFPHGLARRISHSRTREETAWATCLARNFAQLFTSRVRRALATKTTTATRTSFQNVTSRFCNSLAGELSRA